MNKYAEEGMLRHSIENLMIIIDACQLGGNTEMLKEAKEALKIKRYREEESVMAKKCDGNCKKCKEVKREKETLRAGSFRNIRCSQGRKISVKKRQSGEMAIV